MPEFSGSTTLNGAAQSDTGAGAATAAATQGRGAGTQHADGTPVRVLVVDDEPSLAELLSSVLRYEGWNVRTAGNGAEAVRNGREFRPDAVVLDIMLPGLSGYRICEQLRAEQNWVPVLILSAKDGEYDQADGLDLGADDYLTKPFSFKILLARLRALSRRKNVEPRTTFQIGDLVLDPAAREVKRSGSAIALTKTEFLLLETLMRNPGRVITRTRMIDAVWGHGRDIENNTLDVFIRQVRAKIDLPGSHKLIHTIRGVGYALREEDSL